MMRRAYASSIRASHRRMSNATYGRTYGLTNEECISPTPSIFHLRIAHARTAGGSS